MELGMLLPHPPLLKKPAQAGRSRSLHKACIARGLLCGGGGQGDPRPWDWYPLQTQKRPFWLLPYHPSFPLPLPLCCFHEEFSGPAQHVLPGTHERNQIWKRHVHPNVHRSTVHNSQDVEAAWMSIGRRTHKKAVVHIHNRILLSHEK